MNKMRVQNEADKIFLGKAYVDLCDAIEKTTNHLEGQTTTFKQELMESFGVRDDRAYELDRYRNRTHMLLAYAEVNGITHDELKALGEAYKRVTFGYYMELRKQVTIQSILDIILKA